MYSSLAKQWQQGNVLSLPVLFSLEWFFFYPLWCLRSSKRNTNDHWKWIAGCAWVLGECWKWAFTLHSVRKWITLTQSSNARAENESRMWFSDDIWCCLSSGTVHRFGVEETQHLTAGEQLHSFWSDLLALRSFKKMGNNMKRGSKGEEKVEGAIGPVWRLWEAVEGQKSGFSRLSQLCL